MACFISSAGSISDTGCFLFGSALRVKSASSCCKVNRVSLFENGRIDRFWAIRDDGLTAGILDDGRNGLKGGAGCVGFVARRFRGNKRLCLMGQLWGQARMDSVVRVLHPCFFGAAQITDRQWPVFLARSRF